MFGKGLGTSTGRLVIDVSQLYRAESVVLSVAGSMNKAFAGLETDFFDKGTAAGLAAGVSAAIAVTQRVKTLTAVFKTLAKDEQVAVTYLGQLRNMADEAKMSYLELLDGANNLIPIIRTYNLDFEKTIKLAQQLAAYDPAQGFLGAGIGIREFVSGDIISLQRRFEINRAVLNNIMDQSNGNMSVAIGLLQEYINKIGVSEQDLIDLGQQGIFVFQRLSSSIQEALSFTFTPILDGFIVPLIDGFSRILDLVSTLDPMLASMGSRAVTGLMAASSLGALGMPKTGRGVASIMAASIAIDVGKTIAMSIARAQGRTDLTSKSREDLDSYLNQRVREMMNAGLETAGKIGGIIAMFGKALEIHGTRLFESIRIIADRIVDGAEALITLVTSSISQLAQLIVVAGSSLLHAIGTMLNIVGVGQDLINMANEAQLGAMRSFLEEQQKFQNALATLYTMSQTDISELAYPDLPADTNEQIAQAGIEAANNITAFSQAVLLALFPLEQVADEGADVGQGLSTFGSSIQAALTAFTNTDAFKEAAEEIEKLSDSMKKANDEFLIDSTREAFDFARGRLRDLQDYQKTVDDAFEDYVKSQQRVAESIAEINTEADEDEAEAAADHLKELEELQEDHARKIFEIQKDADMALEDAIMEGSIKRAIQAVKNYQDALEKENYNYSQRLEKLDESLQDEIAHIEARRQVNLESQQKELEDLRLAHQERLADMAEDFALRLQREDEDRATRLQRDQEDFDRQRALQIEAHEKKMMDLTLQAAEEAGLFKATQEEVSRFGDGIRSAHEWLMSQISLATDNAAAGTITSMDSLSTATTAFVSGMIENAKNLYSYMLFQAQVQQQMMSQAIWSPIATIPSANTSGPISGPISVNMNGWSINSGSGFNPNQLVEQVTGDVVDFLRDAFRKAMNGQ